LLLYFIMRELLERFRRGECEQVWEELYALGPAVRQGDLYPDAQAVALETMRRVRHNIELLIPRLEELGYEFGYAWMKQERFRVDETWRAEQPVRYTSPPSAINERLQRFEEQAGLMPLSLRAFYREVGGVNFVGRHPAWEQLFEAQRTHGIVPSNLDPLVVWGFELIDHYYASLDEESPFQLPIAADYELKYDISGAGPYWIEMPDAAADALLLGEWHQTTFVNYLRLCLHYGGLARPAIHQQPDS
jgi:hypothetical protein